MRWSSRLRVGSDVKFICVPIIYLFSTTDVLHVFNILIFVLVGNVGTPSIDFSRHVVIKPKIFHGREKRQISTTLEDVRFNFWTIFVLYMNVFLFYEYLQEGLHTHDLTLGYNIDGKEYTLDLRLNRELIPANFFVRYQHQGKHVVNNTTEKVLKNIHH